MHNIKGSVRIFCYCSHGYVPRGVFVRFLRENPELHGAKLRFMQFLCIPAKKAKRMYQMPDNAKRHLIHPFDYVLFPEIGIIFEIDIRCLKYRILSCSFLFNVVVHTENRGFARRIITGRLIIAIRPIRTSAVSQATLNSIVAPKQQ